MDHSHDIRFKTTTYILNNQIDSSSNIKFSDLLCNQEDSCKTCYHFLSSFGKEVATVRSLQHCNDTQNNENCPNGPSDHVSHVLKWNHPRNIVTKLQYFTSLSLNLKKSFQMQFSNFHIFVIKKCISLQNRNRNALSNNT